MQLLQHDHTDAPTDSAGLGHDALLIGVTIFVVGLAVYAYFRYVFPRRGRGNR